MMIKITFLVAAVIIAITSTIYSQEDEPEKNKFLQEFNAKKKPTTKAVGSVVRAPTTKAVGSNFLSGLNRRVHSSD